MKLVRGNKESKDSSVFKNAEKGDCFLICDESGAECVVMCAAYKDSNKNIFVTIAKNEHEDGYILGRIWPSINSLVETVRLFEAKIVPLPNVEVHTNV